MVVWIEILYARGVRAGSIVTTCVVVWIEIFCTWCCNTCRYVTTCVVVWIEIGCAVGDVAEPFRHHLRGGVD